MGKILSLAGQAAILFPCIPFLSFWERNMSLSLLIMNKITHKNSPQKARKKNYQVISLSTTGSQMAHDLYLP